MTSRVAIVGHGRMGERHVAAARSLGHEVVGIVDPRLEARQRAVDVATYEDLDGLLSTTTPDCLVVATTADSHAPLVIDAARAGVGHILCEKPMATSLAECDAMLAACAATGARLAVNHQMRFLPHYLALREVVDGIDFGGWTSITAVTGNVGLAMNGVHYFELFRWLSGEPLSTVSAWFDDTTVANPRGPQFQDRSGCLRATSAKRRRLYIDASGDQGHGLLLVVAGAHGTAVLDELEGELTVTVREVDQRDLPTTRYALPAIRKRIEVTPTDVVQPTADVLDALLTAGDHPTGDDGRAALAVLVAAHSSAIDDGSLRRVDDAPIDLVLPIA